MENTGNKTAENQQQVTQGEKMFTQEEVNEIVQNRLNRVKKQDNSGDSNPLAAKEAELQAREMRINARETVTAVGLPIELAIFLDGKDKEENDKRLELLKRYFKQSRESGLKVLGDNRLPKSMERYDANPLRRAMGLDN